jgi:pilus assembly protein CpaF
MVNLSLTEKGGSTNELSFEKDEVTIGRVRGNDVVLPKGNVSKHHCRLIVRNGEIFVEDLRSTNGTYVNGRKIVDATPISTTDKVFVGDFIIRLTLLASSMDALRPSVLSGPPEAGSLSSAIPRRPPPPPPPVRGSTAMDEGHGSSPQIPPVVARSPLPPPPPPPPHVAFKRETKAVPSIGDTFHSTSAGPSDINLDDDDDALGTPHPHIPVPPLKPAIQPSQSLLDVETPQGGEEMPPTPPPARDRLVHSLTTEDAAPPEPPASANDDVVESQGVLPPDPDDIFPPVANEKPRPVHKPHEGGKASDSAKVKTAPPATGSAAVKQSSRLFERDVPEWLSHLLEGDGVTAAFFTGTNQAEVQRYGRRESVSVPASDLMTLGAAIRKMAIKGSPKPAADASAINTTLSDGMHVAAIFPPVADRLCIAIRRPVAVGKTIDNLIDEKVISAEMHQVLEACVSTHQNILVSGDRAACDSLLRAVLWSVDRVARVALLSDSINPPASATSWIKLQPESQTSELISATVAMQPEYLVVDANHSALSGAVLGECNLGLEGVILSVVARSTNDALARLQMLGSAQGLSSTVAADLVASSIDVIVQASVLLNGSLKVVEIAEPKASLDGQLSSHALLTWIAGDDDTGSFTVTGAHSALAAKLASAGANIPTEILNRQ